MVLVVCHGALFFILAASAGIQDMQHNLLYMPLYQSLYYARTQIHGQAALFFQCPCGLCAGVRTCCFRLSGMIMCLPLSISPSITTGSSLYSQYGLMLVCSSSLIYGQPAIINVLVVEGGHPVMIHVVYLLWIYILGCPLSSGWYPPIHPYPL